MKNKVLLQILCVTASVALASWALVMDRAGLAQPTPEGKKQQAQVGTLEDAKQKGFEGVDFSYDVFGAPSGQDGLKTAEEVMKMDIAEKPDVMKRQHKLLNDRYDLSCRTEKGIMMTKGKPQPVGPIVKLGAGLTWEQLGQLSPDEIKKKGASSNFRDWNASMWTSICRTACCRSFLRRSFSRRIRSWATFPRERYCTPKTSIDCSADWSPRPSWTVSACW
jgi:hypothetical protein